VDAERDASSPFSIEADDNTSMTDASPVADSAGQQKSSPGQEPISRESMERFAHLGHGQVIGEAIASAYQDHQLRNDTAFMEWLVKPGSRAAQQMDALGILIYNNETHIILDPELAGK
jgi:hypothetical protein